MTTLLIIADEFCNLISNYWQTLLIMTMFRCKNQSSTILVCRKFSKNIVNANERILMHVYTISETMADTATTEQLITEDSNKIEGSGQNIDDDAGK